MRTKNFVIEVIVNPDSNRTFIVRVLPVSPDQPAQVCAVCKDEGELASFFGSSELFK